MHDVCHSLNSLHLHSECSTAHLFPVASTLTYILLLTGALEISAKLIVVCESLAYAFVSGSALH